MGRQPLASSAFSGEVSAAFRSNTAAKNPSVSCVAGVSRRYGDDGASGPPCDHTAARQMSAAETNAKSGLAAVIHFYGIGHRQGDPAKVLRPHSVRSS